MCHSHYILRCGFRARCRRGDGREFAIGPDGAIFEILFFPDGHGALESVNGEAAGVEGGGTVRRADGDEDGGFADFQTAKAMDDGDAMDGEFFVQLRANLAHFRESHRFVGFVLEVKSRAIAGLVADETVEGDGRAVFGSANVARERGHVNGPAHQPVDVIVDGCGHGGASAAAHGREERDFIAGMKRGIPRGKFLVARSDERRAVFGEIRMARGVESEELFDRRGVV